LLVRLEQELVPRRETESVNGTACGTSPSHGTAQQAAVDPPFTISEVARFDSPWAMDFLPGRPFALVTEKPGRIWWVDVATGRKIAVSGVPKVVLSDQGGLLDLVVSPDFAQRGEVYLTYAEPSGNSDGGLALARARFIRTEDGAKLYDLKVIWRDPAGGNGGQFGARIAFAPDGKSLFLSSGERQRFTPAQDPSQPLGKILHLTLDGQPAPGNPWAGKTGASTVLVTDPPETPKRPSMRRLGACHGRGRTRRRPRHGLWGTATRSAWRSRRTDVCGKPKWARRAATRST